MGQGRRIRTATTWFAVVLALALAAGTAIGTPAATAATTSISGTVFVDGGAPPAGSVCVTLYVGSIGHDWDDLAFADGAGRYRFEGLAPGQRHFVHFADCADGGAHLPQFYDGAEDAASAKAVVPGSGTPATGIDAHLRQGATISGTARDASGQPITTGDVCMTTDGARGRSDATGRFALGGLSAGDHVLRFEDCFRSARDDLPTYSGDVTTAAAATPVSLGAREQRTGADVRMAAGTSIRGTIYGGPGTGRPTCGSAGVVDPPDDGLGHFADADANGRYRLGNLPERPEGYQVRASGCGSTSLGAYAADGAYAHPTVAAPTTGFDAHLPLAGSLDVLVRDPAGRAVTTQDVCLSVRGGGYERQSRSDADGHVLLEGLTTDHYVIAADACLGAVRTDRPGRSEVDVVQGSTAHAEVRLSAGASLGGTIYGDAGTDWTLDGICANAWTVGDGGGLGFTVGRSIPTGVAGTYRIGALDPGVPVKVRFNDCSGTGLPEQWFDRRASDEGARLLTPTLAGPLTGIDAHFALAERPPRTRLVLAPAPGSESREASPVVRFVADRPDATFACSVDQAEWAPCASPLEIGPLVRGSHDVRVRATAGNATERRYKSIRWSVDPTGRDRVVAGEALADGTFSTAPDGVPTELDPLAATLAAGRHVQVTATLGPRDPDDRSSERDPGGARVELTATDLDRGGPLTPAGVDHPMEVGLLAQGSQLPPGTPLERATATVDDVVAPECSAGTPTLPCVDDRRALPGGAVAIGVRTAVLGRFAIAALPGPPAAPAPPPSGSPAPGATPTTATAPSAVPVPVPVPVLGALGVRLGAAAPVRLAALGRTGVTVRLATSSASRATVRLVLDARRARSLGLRATTVATTRTALGPVARVVRLRPRAAVARRLAREARVPLLVRVTARAAHRRAATTQRRVVLRR